MTLVYNIERFGAKVSVFGKPDGFPRLEQVITAARSLEIAELHVLVPGNATGKCFTINGAKVRHSAHVEGFNISQFDRDVDGIIVGKGVAVGILTADCPTIISRDRQLRYVEGKLMPQRFAILHGGRNSLLQPKRVVEAIKSPDGLTARNPRQGIIESLFLDHSWCIDESQFFMACGIAPKNFFHSYNDPQQTQPDYNRKMLEHINKLFRNDQRVTSGGPGAGGYTINLKELAEAEARILCGYRGASFKSDGLDTFQHGLLWSRRRGESGNNLIIVQT